MESEKTPKSNELFNNIIKKHDYYEAKFKIISPETEKEDKYKDVPKGDLNLQIEIGKKKIEEYKRLQLKEEESLLNLYKLKN